MKASKKRMKKQKRSALTIRKKKSTGKKLLTVILMLAVIAIILAAAAFFVPKLTGNAVFSSTPGVTRTAYFQDGEVKVKLNIQSKENILAVKETLPSWTVVTWQSISGDFENTAFKPSENTWIIADKNKTINGAIEYSIKSDPRILNFAGESVYFSGNALRNKKITGVLSICASKVCMNSSAVAGGRLDFNYNTDGGIGKVLYLYNEGQAIVNSQSVQCIPKSKFCSTFALCTSKTDTCKTFAVSKSFTIPKSWPNGKYFISVINNGSVESYSFNVTGSSAPAPKPQPSPNPAPTANCSGSICLDNVKTTLTKFAFSTKFAINQNALLYYSDDSRHVINGVCDGSARYCKSIKICNSPTCMGNYSIAMPSGFPNGKYILLLKRGQVSETHQVNFLRR